MWLCVCWKSFLNNRETSAHFHWTANTPDCGDEFIILVITGSKTSMQLITSVVGIGSSKHDFLGVDSMSFRTSDWLSVLNFSIKGTSDMHSFAVQKGGVKDMLSSLVSMVSIFWIKNNNNNNNNFIHPYTHVCQSLLGCVAAWCGSSWDP